MNAKIWLIGLISVVSILFLYPTFGVEPSPDFPYRPTCAHPNTINNKPWSLSDDWVDGEQFVSNGVLITRGAYELCYINESMMFIQYDWGNANGKLFRDFKDVYSTNIGGQSNALKAKQGFTVHFEYYIPSNNGVCYPLDMPFDEYGNPQPWISNSPGWTQYGWSPYQPWYSKTYVFMNNVKYSNANCGGCTDYEDAIYTLFNQSCDEWHTFEFSSNDFENDFVKSDRLVSFGLNTANMYLSNVWFARSGVFYQLY